MKKKAKETEKKLVKLELEIRKIQEREKRFSKPYYEQ